MTQQLEETLAERGSRYGIFAHHARAAQRLQDAMRTTANWDRLADDSKQALTVIADKIARILTGDPEYEDNWHDIQGYAKLVEDRILSRGIYANEQRATINPISDQWADNSCNLGSVSGTATLHCGLCGTAHSFSTPCPIGLG